MFESLRGLLTGSVLHLVQGKTWWLRRNLQHELLEQDVMYEVYEGRGSCACAWGTVSSPTRLEG